MFSVFAKGKLMITGEYVVLDGAASFALPVKYGQHLMVEPGYKDGQLNWVSIDKDGNAWFWVNYLVSDFSILSTNNDDIARRLQELLVMCRSLNQGFCSIGTGWEVHLKANFPLDWGLGSSSTLIASVAKWADVNPFQLSYHTFGGSGYDIACAFADGPIIYQLDVGQPAGERESISNIQFDPPFKNDLFFHYLGNKQDSREGIRHYRSLDKVNIEKLVDQITQLTLEIISTEKLSTFEELLLEHEILLSKMLDIPRIQDRYFPGFNGVIKSLGAWGGDFVLSTGSPIDGNALTYSEMVWNIG